jgi:chemotaxis regulatin CheY-phosphate phosphatase CheZ
VAGLTNEHLQDSAATLRLVDDLVAELASLPDEEGMNAGLLRMLERLAEHQSESRSVERAFVRMYAELQRILYKVRQSRGLLEEAALTHLETTTAKLQEVSSTTEHAATNMLDGVDRALVLVDKVENEPDPEAFQSLREELYALVVALQFQDISSQQLEHASAIIADLEGQLRRVVRIFALSVFNDEGDDGRPKGDNGFKHPMGAFDPAASTQDAATRQAVADDIFKVG